MLRLKTNCRSLRSRFFLLSLANVFSFFFFIAGKGLRSYFAQRVSVIASRRTANRLISRVSEFELYLRLTEVPGVPLVLTTAAEVSKVFLECFGFSAINFSGGSN